ncbi:MAG: divalent-cation tolerance protein CutA [Planctomycetota bacterium]|nr:divalent-cation tolerance protein CutA [Planctomycetota bacterium]
MLVVLCTAPDAEVARRIARELVGEGLAACVNLVPGLTSIYRWEGAVEEATEVLLLIKLEAGGYPALEARVLELHPYDTPELIALAAALVEPRYAAWLGGA